MHQARARSFGGLVTASMRAEYRGAYSDESVALWSLLIDFYKCSEAYTSV